ncbi:hypothetical protein RvY_08561-2 [Ramazzottius varieornatus]|nr:hypothetical protein RvY_08561-2 [Ramazzottius varieornatus]
MMMPHATQFASLIFQIASMGKSSKDKRDIYYRLAKEQGWRARSAFKLLQIQEKIDIFRDVKRVVDLCAAPGSWSQVLSKTIYEPCKDDPSIRIIAVDLQPMAPLEGVMQLQGDITDRSTADNIIAHLDGQLSDLVVCDGAPDVVGLLDFDEYVQHQLVLSALDLTSRILKSGGTMVAKVFRGKRIGKLCADLKLFFPEVVIAKPKCSRDSSLEAFVVCQNYVPLPEFTSSSDNLLDYLAEKNPARHLSENLYPEVPFLVCGEEGAFDSDRTYPLNLTEGKSEGQKEYEYKAPVQPPINPPYKEAQKMRKDKTLFQPKLPIQL